MKYIGIIFLLLSLYSCVPKVESVSAQKPITDSTLIVDTSGQKPIIDSTLFKDSVKVVIQTPKKSIKQQLLLKLDSQLYIREIKPNRSPEIDMFNKNVGVPVGSKWCAAFVSYNLTYFNIPNPNSAWSPSFSKPEDVIWKPKMKNAIEPDSGDVVSYYNPKLKRVYHVGLFGYFDKNGIPIVYEGNTSGGFGGVDNDGDGVYKKKRDMEKFHAVSRFIKK